jgi:PEP-CTERM motif
LNDIGGNMKSIVCNLILTLSIAGIAHGALISLNDPVTLTGSFPAFSAVCGPLSQPSAGSVDNGTFQPEETCYQAGIHWQGSSSGDTTHTIALDFGGPFLINGAIVQADDNDTYELDYLGTDNAYHLWWSIPEDPSFGLVTRPNADQTTIMTLPTVEALGVQIFATGGDGLYAVSQVEVFGDTVPEPNTLILLGLGMGALCVIAPRRSVQSLRRASNEN